jgi:hypothetical protein
MVLRRGGGPLSHPFRTSTLQAALLLTPAATHAHEEGHMSYEGDVTRATAVFYQRSTTHEAGSIRRLAG